MDTIQQNLLTDSRIEVLVSIEHSSTLAKTFLLHWKRQNLTHFLSFIERPTKVD